MSNLAKTKKVCANGHVMEPGWDVCPYCPSSRMPKPELAKTVRSIPKTIPASPPAVAPLRKTELVEQMTTRGIAWLVATGTPDRGRMHRIDAERVTVGGTEGCEVVIEDPQLSARHASMRIKDKDFILTDLDSSNGTFVNGQRIYQQTLNDGDTVRFGSSEWVFKCVVFDNA